MRHSHVLIPCVLPGGGGGSTPVRFDVPVGMATRTCGRYATRLVQGAPPAVSSPYITARGHALKAAVTSCGDFVNYYFLCVFVNH